MKITEGGKSLLKVFARTEEEKSEWLLTFDATKQGIPSAPKRKARMRRLFQ